MAGGSLTDAFQTGSYNSPATGSHQGSSATRRFGASIGISLRLPHGFAAECDVLDERVAYDIYDSLAFYANTSTFANSLEIPVLAVYDPPHLAGLTPRLSGGISLRAVAGAWTTGAHRYALVCIDSGNTGPASLSTDPHMATRSLLGATAAASIEKRLVPLRLGPQLPYTRWRAGANSSGPFFDLRSNPNQLDFLLGITF